MRHNCKKEVKNIDTITFVLYIISFSLMAFLYARKCFQLEKAENENILLKDELRATNITGSENQLERIKILEESYNDLYVSSLQKNKQIEQLQNLIKIISCGHFKPDYEKRIIKFDKKDLAVKLAGELISQDDVLSNTKTITFIPYSEKL